MNRHFFSFLRSCPALALLAFTLFSASIRPARGEQILELFNCTWAQVTQKMPEIAEAGYDALWLPNPAKGASGGYSVGYDQFDPFDLGNLNQAGSVATMYGTEAQLLIMVQTAHRFGIRVYFDNIMNHRGTTVPGYNSSTPTNFYPGLIPQDFHLQVTSSGHYQNWPTVQDYNNQWDVQNESLAGLVDLANEPGSINDNFGATLGSTTTKPVFVRQPHNPAYYMNTNGPSIGGPWFPIDGNGQPVAEDVNAYLIRAAMWTMATTKCDGFRLDAVKHVPVGFFGDSSPSFNGYAGGIQAMYDWVHGYGNNVISNGYVEGDDMRNSMFNTEAPRNDAMLFGEHLGPPPSVGDYIQAGMRLLNTPLHNIFNNNLGSPSAGLQGLDSAGYVPPSENGYNCFPVTQGVQYAQNQDASGGYANHRDLQDAYNFMQEGIGIIYTDNYNQSGPPSYFPTVADANAFGEYGDNQMPELAYIHNQMARGLSWSRWSDNDTILFERYDYREGTNTQPQNQDVVLFGLNDNYGNPGDISFDDGISRTSDGYYGGKSISNSRGVGVVVGFPPGSVLVQMAKSSSGSDRAYKKLLVHGATKDSSLAQSTANDPTPQNRLIYVGGQTLAQNGGAVELTIPSGGYVMYGYQWPEASRVALKNAITLRQNGVDAPRLFVNRMDGANGDKGFNPSYPFANRGSVDQYGNVIHGTNVGNLTYAIDIPVVTNANFDFVVDSDASCANTLIKLDGGIDINSQMGLGPTNGPDLRDFRPGYTNDVFMGYEHSAFVFQNGPEKFAARNILSNTVISLGAETYFYTVGQTNILDVPGSGYDQTMTNQTANWVFHDPTNTVTSQSTNPPTQLFPLAPASNQSVQIYVKVGYQFQINTCYIYYTTDGSNPEGSFGVGTGTTQTVQGHFYNHDSAQQNIDWWKGTIPGQPTNGTQVRYKVALFYNNISAPISDSETSGSKYYGLTQYAVTNFNPTNARVWLHNDLNPANATNGLQEGYHIVRAHVFLPRSGKSSVFNTFSQTFYYDAQLPSGVIVYPSSDGAPINSSTYTLVLRTDSTVTGVTYNIADSNPNNDDGVTGFPNGNGNSNGVPAFVPAQLVTPSGTLNQQYPNLPQEWHFNYAGVPSSGAATITVHLNKVTTGVYTNRYTALTRSVTTSAPAQSLAISEPVNDGDTLYLTPSASYPIQACYSSSLGTNANLFTVLVNSVIQPRTNSQGASLYSIGSSSCGYGLYTLTYNWTGAIPGTNIIQVNFTNNATTLGATRTVNVINPSFGINEITGDPASGFTVIWNTYSNLNYQVLATTNLQQPFQPISGVIPGNGSSAFFFDTSPNPISKFYTVVLMP
jgi:hypothetical protein